MASFLLIRGIGRGHIQGVIPALTALGLLALGGLALCLALAMRRVLCNQVGDVTAGILAPALIRRCGSLQALVEVLVQGILPSDRGFSLVFGLSLIRLCLRLVQLLELRERLLEEERGREGTHV